VCRDLFVVQRLRYGKLGEAVRGQLLTLLYFGSCMKAGCTTPNKFGNSCRYFGLDKFIMNLHTDLV
jgi:hypothetical protein